MTEELIAPCGMNCAVCSAYLALTHGVKRKGMRMPYCQGCRPRRKKCAFLKKQCSLLMNDKVHYCFECCQFPCRRLRRIDDRYRTHFHMSLIENLEFIRNNQVQAFLDMQKRKWQCPKCGGTVNCHNGVCFGCNLEMLKRRKNLYRWQE